MPVGALGHAEHLQRVWGPVHSGRAGRGALREGETSLTFISGERDAYT